MSTRMAVNPGNGAGFGLGSARVLQLRDRRRRTTFRTAIGAVVAAMIVFAVATTALASMPAKTEMAVTDYAALGSLVQLRNPIVNEISVPAHRLDALRAAAAWTFQQPGFWELILAARSDRESANAGAAEA